MVLSHGLPSLDEPPERESRALWLKAKPAEKNFCHVERSFVVVCAFKDGKGSIDLLQKDNSCHLVSESHCRKGKL